jgi:hypothetical protein
MATTAPLSADIIEIAAAGRGVRSSTGFQTIGNTNYGVGNGVSPPREARSWLSFDTSGLAGQIESVELIVVSTGYASSDPFESVDLREVTTNFDDLFATQVSLPIFDDLADGALYGSFTLKSDTPDNSVVVISLNANAIQSLQESASSGDFWSVGMSMTTMDDDMFTQEVLFPSSQNVPLSETYLRITTIPAPGVLALLGAAGLCGRRRRRR